MKEKLQAAHLCVEIIALLHYTNRTAKEIAASLGGHRLDTIRLWCEGLESIGLVHKTNTPTGRIPAIYAFGPGDAGFQPAPWSGRKLRTTKYTLSAFAALWEQLSGEPASMRELQEATGMAMGTIRGLIRRMQARKIVRLAAWERRVGIGGAPWPLYRVGSGSPAPRPVPDSHAFHKRAYYQRNKTAEAQAKKLSVVFKAAA